MHERVSMHLLILSLKPVEMGDFVPFYAADAQDARRKADAWLAQRDVQEASLVEHPQGYHWRLRTYPANASLPGTPDDERSPVP